MIVLALLATFASFIWTWIVVMANGMSAISVHGFQGGFSLVVAWVITAALYVAWWVG